MTDQSMPQGSAEIRRINWAACFPFMNLFRTFRLAMQPSKLALALAAVLLTSVWGDLLDGMWRSKCQPPASEIDAFWQQSDIKAWRESVKANWAQSIRDACAPVNVRLREKLAEQLVADPDDAFDSVLANIRKDHDLRIEGLRHPTNKSTLSKEDLNAAVTEKSQAFAKAYRQVQAIAPRGVYASFVEYEQAVGHQLLKAATRLNFTEGMPDVLTSRTGQVVPQTRAPRRQIGQAGIVDVAPFLILDGGAGGRLHDGMRGMGILPCAVLALRGLQWMVWEHLGFAVLFWLPVLVIWGLFGGAICRMAALAVARDERPSAGTGMRFAQRRIASLAMAPLFPVGFALVIGVVLFAGGVVMAIPGIGELIGGLGMPVGIVAGLLIGAVLIGGLAGAPLMWPTIAAEGSDAFDAFSRGYSYVFNRPWRAGFYAAVLTVYGAICYLVVRFFVLVGLKAARLFIGAGLAGTSRPATGNAGATKIDVLWPIPTWDQLLPDRLPLGAQGWDGAGAFLIGLWLTIVLALLCAFAASFFLSGSTIMYYLLRREVDSTDLEEIYLENDEEEDEPLDLPSAAGEPGADSASPSVKVEPEPPASPAPSGPAPDASPGTGDGNVDAE